MRGPAVFYKKGIVFASEKKGKSGEFHRVPWDVEGMQVYSRGKKKSDFGPVKKGRRGPVRVVRHQKKDQLREKKVPPPGKRGTGNRFAHLQKRWGRKSTFCPPLKRTPQKLIHGLFSLAFLKGKVRREKLVLFLLVESQEIWRALRSVLYLFRSLSSYLGASRRAKRNSPAS